MVGAIRDIKLISTIHLALRGDNFPNKLLDEFRLQLVPMFKEANPTTTWMDIGQKYEYEIDCTFSGLFERYLPEEKITCEYNPNKKYDYFWEYHLKKECGYNITIKVINCQYRTILWNEDRMFSSFREEKEKVRIRDIMDEKNLRKYDKLEKEEDRKRFCEDYMSQKENFKGDIKYKVQKILEGIPKEDIAIQSIFETAEYIYELFNTHPVYKHEVKGRAYTDLVRYPSLRYVLEKQRNVNGKKVVLFYKDRVPVDIPYTPDETTSYLSNNSNLSDIQLSQNVPENTLKRVVKIINPYANIRSGPGTKFNILWTATAYDEYEYIEQKAGWIRIQSSKGEGWVSNTLVEIIEKVSPPLVVKETVRPVSIDVDIDVEKNIPYCTIPNENALAVIIGIEKYKYMSPAIYADRDAFFIQQYFTRVLGVPDTKNNIYILRNENATLAEFEKIFSENGWIEKHANSKSNIYVYFSGHGMPDIDKDIPNIMPFDADPNYPTQTGFSLNRLYNSLGKLKVKSVIIFIDACFSGFTRDNKMLLVDARPIFLEVNNPIIEFDHLTVITASKGGQISSVYPEKCHGLFTYYLMKGLRGDANLNKDKKLTLEELEEYLISNISKTAGLLNRSQIPEVNAQNKLKVLIAY